MHFIRLTNYFLYISLLRSDPIIAFRRVLIQRLNNLNNVENIAEKTKINVIGKINCSGDE